MFIKPRDLEPPHHLFNHSEEYVVCPECGLVIGGNLPDDDGEQEDFFATYNEWGTYLYNRPLEVIWYLTFGLCFFMLVLFLLTLSGVLFGNDYLTWGIWRGRLSGPFTETFFSQLLCLRLASKSWFYGFSKAFSSNLEQDLAEGGSGFYRLWLLRVILWHLILFGTHFFRPQLRGDDSDSYRTYVFLSNLFFYLVFISVLVREYYTYRRFQTIQFLNGYQEDN